MDSQHDDPAQAQDASRNLNLTLALDAARIGAWEWNPATGAMSCNRRMRVICGISQEIPATFDSFLTRVRREDRSDTRAALLQILRGAAPRSIECRMADSSRGTDRWISIEGRPYALAGIAIHMLGTARDISRRKLADAQRELVVREMDHRVKNVFAVMRAVVSMSARRAPTVERLADALEGRIGALARAHGLLLSARLSGGAVELYDVIEGELAPFTDLSDVSIRGARIKLGNRQAVALNVIAHELTTNAIKYGALSHPGGRLSIDWRIEASAKIDCLVLCWQEYCAQPTAPPSEKSVGFKLLTASARSSLRGDISLDFERTGLVARLIAPVSYLTEDSAA